MNNKRVFCLILQKQGNLWCLVISWTSYHELENQFTRKIRSIHSQSKLLPGEYSDVSVNNQLINYVRLIYVFNYCQVIIMT